MWARKRIDVGYSQLRQGLVHCVFGAEINEAEAQLANLLASDALVTCLSVRSGFDLALQALNLPADSEILFTGYTIQDMPQIAAANGLRPVGVDLDSRTLTPSAESLNAAVNSKTRALVVAHLMGGRYQMEPIVDFARKHQLVLIEDCAQAFIGNHYTGHAQADLSMFSFGPIKTHTALGGGILLVRNSDLLSRMRCLHQSWPAQPNRQFAKRLAKYGFLRLLSGYYAAAAVRLGFKLFGSSHDQFAMRMGRSFHGGDLLGRIRQRPSTALVRFLADRLTRFDPNTIDCRRRLGEQLQAMLEEVGFTAVGSQLLDPTHWVFAVIVERPKDLVRQLWEIGFDATCNSSLRPVANHQDERSLPMVEHLHRHIVFLPLHIEMKQHDLEQMVRVIAKHTEANFVLDSTFQSSEDKNLLGSCAE